MLLVQGVYIDILALVRKGLIIRFYLRNFRKRRILIKLDLEKMFKLELREIWKFGSSRFR